VSIGDYVLSGSHVAALTVLDSNPQNRMSALPPKADITAAQTDVRFVPKADIGEVYGTGLHYGPRVTLALGGPGLA